jgi:hypothetical protein
MNMSAYIFFLSSFFISLSIIPGNSPSSGTKVYSIEKRYSVSAAVVRDQKEAADRYRQERSQQIESVVSSIALPRILILHFRSHTEDFSKFDIDPEEQKIFQDAVARRYELNKETIKAMLVKSMEDGERSSSRSSSSSGCHKQKRMAWGKENELLGVFVSTYKKEPTEKISQS